MRPTIKSEAMQEPATRAETPTARRTWFANAISATSNHWPEYLIEAAGLGLFMVPACRLHGCREKEQPEFKLLDTGVFKDDRYFDVFVEYAKGDVEGILIKITAMNRGRETAPLKLLPTIWSRNTWSWATEEARPEMRQVQGDGIGYRVNYEPAESSTGRFVRGNKVMVGTVNANREYFETA
jgi:hypothetical protein